MYLSIILLPLLGSVFSGFLGRKLGVAGSQIVTCSLLVVTTIISVLSFVEVGMNSIPVSVKLFRWIDSESLNILWSFNFDSLTVSMLIPVLVVSSLVHIYSIGYMSHDPHNQRFFSYLSLFTFMMIILVTSDNYLLMFVGWEGVGVCSYLLVSFWFTRIAANQSSISAFLTNRVGDCFLTIGMFAILWSFGNIDYSTVFSTTPFIAENIVTLIGICLLIGAMAKSSQIGLHVWLPMAMEGPTPVSALIHAATMVTAGVYLLMRSSPLIEYSSTALLSCLWIGAITTVFSSLIGLFQQDIKKVIAYSTMSQLGMMVVAIGLSSYNIALFHLVNHAFYKGLLFLGAGAVIHAVSDNQDFRKYGGLRPFLPLTYSVMLIASLSLVAFPFMTGFYSKDFILESAYGQFHFSSIVVYSITTIGAIFTTLYSVKVLYMTFLTNPNGPFVDYVHAHESDIFMSLPLIILAIFSIFFGYIAKDIFIGLGSNFFIDNSLFIHPSHEIMLNTEFAVPTLFKILPLIFTLSLSILSIILLEFVPKTLIYFNLSNIGYNVYGFFSQRFLIELFYNKYVTDFILKLGGQTTKVIDKGCIELIGPYGLEKGLISLSRNMSKLDTGVITSYALYILVGLISYIWMLYSYSIDNNMVIIIVFALFSLVFKDNTKLALHSPPKPYGFASLPLESSLFKWSEGLRTSIATGVTLCVLVYFPFNGLLSLLGLESCLSFARGIFGVLTFVVLRFIKAEHLPELRVLVRVFTFAIGFWFALHGVDFSPVLEHINYIFDTTLSLSDLREVIYFLSAFLGSLFGGHFMPMGASNVRDRLTAYAMLPWDQPGSSGRASSSVNSDHPEPNNNTGTRSYRGLPVPHSSVDPYYVPGCPHDIAYYAGILNKVRDNLFSQADRAYQSAGELIAQMRAFEANPNSDNTTLLNTLERCTNEWEYAHEKRDYYNVMRNRFNTLLGGWYIFGPLSENECNYIHHKLHRVSTAIISMDDNRVRHNLLQNKLHWFANIPSTEEDID